MELFCVIQSLTLTVLGFFMRWLPPRMVGIVYSFTFLLVGLFWVNWRAGVELYKFLRGQIPPAKLLWLIEGDPLSHLRPVPTYCTVLEATAKSVAIAIFLMENCGGSAFIAQLLTWVVGEQI